MIEADISALIKPHWERLRPLIQKAAPWAKLTEMELLAGVLERRFAFFPAENAFVFACLDGSEAKMFLAGGEHEQVAKLEPQIVEWARKSKGVLLSSEVRLGVDRAEQQHKHFKGLGYKRVRVVYEKDLSDGQ